MSRIGNSPVKVPVGVDVKIDKKTVTVKGPKGTLDFSIPAPISIELKDSLLCFKRKNDLRAVRALHGLVRSLVNNMVIGVTKGFTKNLEINGVGYRAKVEGKTLNLSLGFSHPVLYPIDNGISIAVEANTKISVTGIDKQRVGAVAADIRAFYPPEPYKGKGIRYVGEQVRKKAGKSVGK
ncbi:50S ribosomal protein L6 [bacterium]|nr:50S ribosomal protein L6 [bacterium]MCP5463259.1 50S ribosomal protein L6 [bacterium]